MNLSPWFCTSEPPVRPGVYQIKNYVGVITEALFREYLIPFEVTSMLLLAAIVGAVVLAKRRL